MLPNIDPDKAEELARRLGFTPDDSTKVSDEVNAELASFEAVAKLYNPDFGGQTVEDFTFDPCWESDPLNAYISTFELEGDSGGPLSELTIAIKDNMAIAGVPMTGGSHIFESTAPTRNATVVDRLLADGARIDGKTNMDELAYAPTGETSDYGPTSNPVDTYHVPGGSSSGSAAAVAAGAVDAALGSDTGGSVRVPAAFCGVIGFKPTWGVVPRSGSIDLAYSLDHIGPIAPDVKTAARVFETIRGYDSAEPASALGANLPNERTGEILNPPSVSELTLGVPEEMAGEQLSPPVSGHFEDVKSKLRAAGVEVTEVSIPSVEFAVSLFDTIVPVELALTFLSRGVPAFKRISYDPAWLESAAMAIQSRGGEFGDIIQRKTVLGAYLLQEAQGRHYLRARSECIRLIEQFESVLETVDYLIAPTTTDIAPELGEWQSSSYGSDDTPPISVNTRPANLAGVPTVTLPSGEIDGLPLGMQIIGKKYDDFGVLAASSALEDVFDVEIEPEVTY